MAARTHSAFPSARHAVDGVQVNAWHGLRYAEPVARFAPARPAGGRLAADCALHEVPVFPQLPGRLTALMGAGSANPQCEDAFLLNVWAPADAQGLPVLVFLHGGAWMTGGGALAWYDGSRLAARGLVVVNVNYRLGPLGHMGAPDAHALPLPAADLLLALQWVRDHVGGFGGDADRLTLAGQSAGGWYAHLLSVLPGTRGQIHRVALMSMGTRAPWTAQQQRDVTRRARQRMEGDLEQAPVGQVLRAGMAALEREPVTLGHAPSAFLPVASAGLPDRLLDPGWAAAACHARAVYLRNTADESAAFFFDVPQQRKASQAQVDEALSRWPLADLPPALRREGAFRGASSGLSPYRQLVAASSWRQFQRFPAEYAYRLRQSGKGVQLAHFDAESAMEAVHGAHCFDLPFQFGRRDAWADAPMLDGWDADRFEAVARPLMAELAAFAQG